MIRIHPAKNVHRIARVIVAPAQRYGRLAVTALEPSAPGARSRHVLWRCVCDCGSEALVRGSNLTSGKTTSCGCARGGARANSGGNFAPVKPAASPVKILKNGIRVNGYFMPRAELMSIVREYLARDNGEEKNENR